MKNFGLSAIVTGAYLLALSALLNFRAPVNAANTTDESGLLSRSEWPAFLVEAELNALPAAQEAASAYSTDLNQDLQDPLQQQPAPSVIHPPLSYHPWATVTFTNRRSVLVHFEIFDMSGRKVLDQKENYEAGESSKAFNLTYSAAGIYYLVVSDDDGRKDVHKIVHSLAT